MTESDEGVDVSSTALNDKPIQFSLRALLLVMLAIAAYLALFRIAKLVALRLTFPVIVVLAIALGRQRNFRSRYVIGFTIMVGVNLLPLYFTWMGGKK